jgi:hypothetical protein
MLKERVLRQRLLKALPLEAKVLLRKGKDASW